MSIGSFHVEYWDRFWWRPVSGLIQPPFGWMVMGRRVASFDRWSSGSWTLYVGPWRIAYEVRREVV